MILTGGAVALRLTNIAFRVFICGQLGDSGMGLYQLIFSIFSLAVTACTSGVSLAVTRLVAEGNGVRPSVGRCMVLALLISGLAGLVLWCGSGWIAAILLGSPEAARPIRLLVPGLPCMAVCACIKGYFLAVRNTALPAAGELLEQVFTIGAGMLLMSRITPLDALMLGSTLGEASSCLLLGLCFLCTVRRNPGGRAGKGRVATRKVLHIAAPVLCGNFVRSTLNSTENLLVPRGLKQYGAGAAGSLAQYGIMQGMVMPILLFPASFITPLCSLFIPELAERAASGRQKSIQRMARLAMRLTLLFSFIVTTLLIVFAEPLCNLFFNNTQAGVLLRIMAPIVPLMYLDSIVDGMLKGLDQQVSTLKYNFSDSLLRVLFIAVLLPVFGMKAYVFVLFFSEIFNASLSIHRLLKVTDLTVDVVDWVLLPAVTGALLYYFLSFLTALI
ncbi:MATE family efflux transporter [Hydrogeniiclostridium mannosilyticum]|nr:MATE family efflux transporter [Hydrogeniiclostridium mannosilyticum]